jgi:hypothetical protein
VGIEATLDTNSGAKIQRCFEYAKLLDEKRSNTRYGCCSLLFYSR